MRSWLRLPAAATTIGRAHVVVPVIGADDRLVETLQGLGRADDLAAQRVLPEDRLGEVVVDELGRGVFVERDLFEDDLALGVELGHERAARPCRP